MARPPRRRELPPGAPGRPRPRSERRAAERGGDEAGRSSAGERGVSSRQRDVGKPRPVASGKPARPASADRADPRKPAFGKPKSPSTPRPSGTGASKSTGKSTTTSATSPTAKRVVKPKPAAVSKPKAAPKLPVEPMRVHRALARAGVASRRGAEAMIAAGRVTVNGRLATVGEVIDPAHDTIALDGKPVKIEPERVWLVLNKPLGAVTTRRDPAGRQTVFDLVPDHPGLTYVGRLDYLTEGVLLLTTDGAAAHALTHPSHEVERTYVATVRGDAFTAARIARHGVELDDGIARPTAVAVRTVPGRRRYELELTLTEGRHHEVRRICAALGLEVERLVRISFGPVRLGSLESGASRPLTAREAEVLTAIVNSPPHGRHGTRQRSHQRSR